MKAARGGLPGLGGRQGLRGRRGPGGLLGLAGLLALAALLPLALGGYGRHIAVVALYYAILASSWNLLAGYTGVFSLAHHAFAALGGYASGLLVVRAGLPIPAGIAAAALLATAVGYLLGLLTLRMRAIYLALATWAFAESLRLVVAAEYEFTRGDLGLRVPHLLGTSSPLVHYYVFLALALVTLAALRGLLASRVGYRLRALRDDEEAAETSGIDTVRWKKLAFAASSGIAGIAGAFYGHYIGLLSPVAIKFTEMALIVMMAIIGGLGTFFGPPAGAVLLEVLSEALRLSGEIRMVAFALLVIAVMRLYPPGLAGLAHEAARRAGPAPAGRAEPPARPKTRAPTAPRP